MLSNNLGKNHLISVDSRDCGFVRRRLLLFARTLFMIHKLEICGNLSDYPTGTLALPVRVCVRVFVCMC